MATFVRFGGRIIREDLIASIWLKRDSGTQEIQSVQVVLSKVIDFEDTFEFSPRQTHTAFKDVLAWLAGKGLVDAAEMAKGGAA